ncbi:MAG TPA: hypothetical protein VMV86_04490 [Methanosarcinales archaeon]|nr:hypothetical protein [Methanosarcinales archaeon]
METLDPKYIVTEGIAGHWYYHLSYKNDFTKSLCGAQTMPCYFPFSAWGEKGHLNEKYCVECIKIMKGE